MKDKTVAWSTRELADLAGTTVNAVRHYHAIGLLDSPERCVNGYKQYRVQHLVRLLQVRRLVEIGVPLAQLRVDEKAGVVVMGELNDLEARVEAEIERLRRARSDIASIRHGRAPADTPRGFESLASNLSEIDRALVHVMTRLGGGGPVESLARMLAAEPPELREAFSSLGADASEGLRGHLASRMIAAGPNWRSAEWLRSTHPSGGTPSRDRAARRAMTEVLRELYNPAQLDVLDRVESGEAHELEEELSA
jgi:DNA-binding transcriptional MerR regulator